MKNHKSIKNIACHGFTLIELAVVLTIVGILLYTTLTVGAAQLEASRVKQTQDKLEKIQNAIIVYYKVNADLPCPADGSQAVTSSTFGTGGKSGDGTGIINAAAASPVTCSNSNYTSAASHPDIIGGVTPTRTLGLPDDFMFDAWGNKITYIVSRYCIAQGNWSTGYGYRCSTDGSTSGSDSSKYGGKIVLKGKNDTAWPVNAAYILISHGSNGTGAYTRAGTTRTAAASGSATSTAEENNGNLNNSTGAVLGATSAQTTAYYDMLINDGATASTYFDDVVRWKTAAQVDYDATH